MTDIRVTQEQIDLLINSADVEVKTVFGKCTTVCMRLKNGFIITESSACVDPANYDEQQGKKLCFEHIENRLWELEGYALQKQIHEQRRNEECDCGREAESGDFGWAIRQLRKGKRVCRRGWNGKGQFIELASDIGYRNPDGTVINVEHDAIGNKAIAFCGTSGVQMGWLASQADMLAEDWVLA